MRASLCVVVAFFGCGVAEPELDTSEVDQELNCRLYPQDCADPNGHGVYFEELGQIGIGPSRFMITNFRNVDDGGRGSVTISGRYWDSYSGTFKFTTAAVKSLSYTGPGSVPGTQYNLASVDETYTTPTITLKYGLSGTLAVNGPNLPSLRLVLQIMDAYYTVSFAIPATGGHQRQSDVFAMSWNPGTTYNNPQPYCLRADGTPDLVVFQQGIVVNPANAILTRNNNYTTLSCSYGAPATVRSWGYIHRGNTAQSDVFEAAMHMKRASYCGDKSFYTTAGTDIYIWDRSGINVGTGTGPLNYTQVEAGWGVVDSADPGSKIRALCVNLPQLRHHDAQFPISGGAPFTGHCDDGTPTGFDIPSCGPTYLDDQRIIIADQAYNPSP